MRAGSVIVITLTLLALEHPGVAAHRGLLATGSNRTIRCNTPKSPPPLNLNPSSPKRSNLIFLKYTKVGGSSMQYRLFKLIQALSEAYDSAIDYDCRGQNMKADGYCMVLREEILADNGKTPYTFFVEHQTYGLHRYLPGNSHYLLLFRDPIERLISHFFFTRAEGGEIIPENKTERVKWFVENFRKYPTLNMIKKPRDYGGIKLFRTAHYTLFLACDVPTAWTAPVSLPPVSSLWSSEDPFVDCRNTNLSLRELYLVASKRLELAHRSALSQNAQGRFPDMTVGFLTESFNRTMAVLDNRLLQGSPFFQRLGGPEKIVTHNVSYSSISREDIPFNDLRHMREVMKYDYLLYEQAKCIFDSYNVPCNDHLLCLSGISE